MSPTYTHTFKFKIGDENLQGKAEFNVDGVASFEYNDGYTPANMTIAEAKRIPAIFEEFKRVFDEFGFIDEIELNGI